MSLQVRRLYRMARDAERSGFVQNHMSASVDGQIIAGARFKNSFAR